MAYRGGRAQPMIFCSRELKEKYVPIPGVEPGRKPGILAAGPYKMCTFWKLLKKTSVTEKFGSFL